MVPGIQAARRIVWQGTLMRVRSAAIAILRPQSQEVQTGNPSTACVVPTLPCYTVGHGIRHERSGGQPDELANPRMDHREHAGHRGVRGRVPRSLVA